MLSVLSWRLFQIAIICDFQWPRTKFIESAFSVKECMDPWRLNWFISQCSCARKLEWIVQGVSCMTNLSCAILLNWILIYCIIDCDFSAGLDGDLNLLINWLNQMTWLYRIQTACNLSNYWCVFSPSPTGTFCLVILISSYSVFLFHLFLFIFYVF